MRTSSTQRYERGTVAIMTAIALVGLIGIAALAIDGALAYNERRSTQNAADNAALAAAWTACTTGDPVSAGEQVATKNGYTDSTDIIVDVVPEGDNVYRATISSTDETEFAGVIGTNEVTVVSEAVADCTNLGGLRGLAIFGGAPTACGNVVDLSGANKTIDGGVHSNGNLKATGSSSTFIGPVSTAGTIQSPHGDFQGGTTENAPTQDYPVPQDWLDVNYWQANHDFSLSTGNVDESDFPNPGVYYAEGDVRLMGVSLSNITIVATGEINASGPDNSLTPHSSTNGLTLLSFASDSFYEEGVTPSSPCGSGAIHLSASNNEWSGVILAPNGEIQFSNSGADSFSGSLIGYQVKISGSSLNIVYDPDLGGDPQYSVELID